MSKAKILFFGLFFLIHPLAAEQDQKDHSKAQAEKNSGRALLEMKLKDLPKPDENSYINKDKTLTKLTTTPAEREELGEKLMEKFMKEAGMTQAEIDKNRVLTAKRFSDFLKREEMNNDTLFAVYGSLLVAHMVVTDAGFQESDAQLKADAPELKKHLETAIKTIVEKAKMHDIYMSALSKDGHRDLSTGLEQALEAAVEGLVEELGKDNKKESDKKEDK